MVLYKAWEGMKPGAWPEEQQQEEAVQSAKEKVTQKFLQLLGVDGITQESMIKNCSQSDIASSVSAARSTCLWPCSFHAQQESNILLHWMSALP